MQNKKELIYLKKRTFIFMSGALFICILCVCSFAALYPKKFWDEIVAGGKPQQDPANDPPEQFEYYQIDPPTLLADIKNGQKDVFHLLENEPDFFKNVHPYGSFPWSSEEYLSIAKAHHLYLTGEPADGEWKIYSFGNFHIQQCRNDMKGFDSANIIFYKETPELFLVTYMYLRPLERLIYSANTAYERQNRLLVKISDNPDAHFREAEVFQGKISADDALQIAENAGGKEMRQKISNDRCKLTVSYFGDEYWHVGYLWDNANFDIKISASDGSYKVVSK